MAAQIYPSDLTDAEWEAVALLIPAAKPGGRPRSVEVRRIVNGVFYTPAHRLRLAVPAARVWPMTDCLNGLITNDKFCWTRRGALSLSWPRSRPLPRAWRQETPGSGYVPPDDRVSRHHRGGRYASSPSTLMAPAPSTGSSPRRTAALGSGVSARAAVGLSSQRRPSQSQTRRGGQP